MNIIQTWKSHNIPPHYLPIFNNNKKYFEGWNYMFFTDDDIDKFMASQNAEYREYFYGLQYNIQKIDFFRYLAIYQYGGVYLDMDVVINTHLTTLYDTPNLCKFPVEINNITDVIITKQNFHNLVGNYAFYAPPKHDFIKAIIDNIINHRFSNDDINFAANSHTDSFKDVFVYCTTGPLLVTQTYIDYMKENPFNTDIMLLKDGQDNRFGYYGKHCSYGSWK